MLLEVQRCVCATIESHNIGAAVERLHRSQPTVSQYLKWLVQSVAHSLVGQETYA